MFTQLYRWFPILLHKRLVWEKNQNSEKQAQATWNESKYFGWTSDRRMDQQHEATCQAHYYKWTGCGSVSGLQLEMKASWFTLFSHSRLLLTNTITLSVKLSRWHGKETFLFHPSVVAYIFWQNCSNRYFGKLLRLEVLDSWCNVLTE